MQVLIAQDVIPPASEARTPEATRAYVDEYAERVAHAQGVVVAAPCHDPDAKVTYEPWTDGRAVGFRVTHDDGRVEYVYLNPSGGSDDGVGSVFLYFDESGDVTQGATVTHLDMFAE